MDNKEKIDLRDAILLHLEEIERPMSWLSDKAEIPYPTIYALLKQRTFAISDSNLEKINKVLGTDFIND